MTVHRLPPIHDAVRLWEKNESATLRECVAFRRRKLPGWTLAFLREKAPYIFSGELKESALRQAVRKYVPPDSQRSVLQGLEFLLRFIEKHGWQGKELSPCDLTYEGLPVQLRPVGVYYSKLQKQKFVIALQPRLDDVPTDEQFKIWLSALHYKYCIQSKETLDAMIVDLSKNRVSEKRDLRELTSKRLPLLTRKEMDERLSLVAVSYNKAITIVPELPTYSPSKRNTAQMKLI